MAETTTTTVEDMDLSALAEQALEEVYGGAPDRFSDPGPESPVVQHEAVMAPIDLDNDDRVLLVNIYHTEESVFIPEGNRWSGQKAQFAQGRLVTDRDTANKVLAACPHVYEEPKSGEWFTHDESGFRTRNGQMAMRYAAMYEANK